MRIVSAYVITKFWLRTPVCTEKGGRYTDTVASRLRQPDRRAPWTKAI